MGIIKKEKRRGTEEKEQKYKKKEKEERKSRHPFPRKKGSRRQYFSR